MFSGSSGLCIRGRPEKMSQVRGKGVSAERGQSKATFNSDVTVRTRGDGGGQKS